MADPENSSLAEDFARSLDGLFGRRIVLIATAPLHKLPWVLRAACFSAGLVVLTLAAGSLLAEPRALREINVWAGLLLFVSLLAYEWLALQVKRVAGTAIFPLLPPAAVERARAWSTTHFLLRYQTGICATVGLLTAAVVAVALQLFVGHQGPATLLFLAVGSAIVTSLIYAPASISVLSLFSAAGRVELFPLDPNRSPLVSGLRRLGQSTVVASAAMGTVGALGPLLLPGLGPVAYVLAALVLCGGVASSVGQFFIQRYALGALISRSRSDSLKALQGELAPLFARRTELSESEHRTLSTLLALYDRVVSTPARGFSLREALRYGSPLFVPTVTLVLTTLHIQIPAQGFLGMLLRHGVRH